MSFEPDQAAMIMRLREDGMGDPTVTSTSWMRSAKTSEVPMMKKLLQARACHTCHTCPEISGAKFVAYAEKLDLPGLSEESLHD